MKTIYLSGPIQSRTLKEASEWRDEATKELKDYKCLNPLDREFTPDMILKLVQADKMDIYDSDIILVNYSCLNKEITFCGTAMEIYHAYRFHKSIIAFTDLPEEKQSPWMKYHCNKIFKSMTEAIKWIKEEYQNE